MSIRGTILPSLIGAFLASCGMGGGNYAAGPVSLSTPATVNKDMIVCENIAGPDVQCRGKVSPFAKVQLSVHPAGFSLKSLERLIWSVAHAAPLSAIVSANAEGYFQGSVGAAKGQTIEIRSAASRLVLTVPSEGENVSGVMGLMKNMTVDPKGSVWFSAAPRFRSTTAFSWTKLFFSVAHAEDFPAPGLVPEEAASCGVEPSVATPELEPDSRCEIKRLPPGSQVPETVATFGGCAQSDIRFIRPWEGSERWVLSGVRDSVYVVDLEASPPKVAKRIRFPGRVLDAVSMGDGLYVTITGIGAESVSLYRIAGPAADGFHASCIQGIGLGEKLAVYHGIQEVVSSDHWDRQFVTVGRFEEGYRVLTGAISVNDRFEIGPKELFRSPHRLEAAVVTGNFGQSDPGPVRSFFAILSSEEKKLYIVEDEVFLREPARSRTLVHGFELSSYVSPYSLVVDRDLMRIAFLDHGPLGARMVVVPLRLADGVQLDLASAKYQELGDVVPSALVRISEKAYAARSQDDVPDKSAEPSPSPSSLAVPLAARVYAPEPQPPEPPPPTDSDETVPWLVNTQGTQVEVFDKGNPHSIVP